MSEGHECEWQQRLSFQMLVNNFSRLFIAQVVMTDPSTVSIQTVLLILKTHSKRIDYKKHIDLRYIGIILIQKKLDSDWWTLVSRSPLTHEFLNRVIRSNFLYPLLSYSQVYLLSYINPTGHKFVNQEVANAYCCTFCCTFIIILHLTCVSSHLL